MDFITPIELGIVEKLKNDKEYRQAFFRSSVTDSIAIQIRELRKLRSLKQGDLAAATEMKQSAISRIEQAEYSSWTFNTLSRVAEALDAKLTVTFQPAEQAIKEHEAAEYGIHDSNISASAFTATVDWMGRMDGIDTADIFSIGPMIASVEDVAETINLQ